LRRIAYFVTSVVCFREKVFAFQPAVVVSSMSNGGGDCSHGGHTVDVVVVGVYIYNLPTTTKMMVIDPAVFFHAARDSSRLLYYHSQNWIIGFDMKKNPHRSILQALLENM